MSGVKSLAKGVALTVSLEDIEPIMFGSMRESAKAIGMGEGVIRYARNNGRDFMRRSQGGSIRVFSIKWC